MGSVVVVVVVIMVEQDPSSVVAMCPVCFLKTYDEPPSLPSPPEPLLHKLPCEDEALINAKDRVPLARIQEVFPSSPTSKPLWWVPKWMEARLSQPPQ